MIPLVTPRHDPRPRLEKSARRSAVSAVRVATLPSRRREQGVCGVPHASRRTARLPRAAAATAAVRSRETAGGSLARSVTVCPRPENIFSPVHVSGTSVDETDKDSHRRQNRILKNRRKKQRSCRIAIFSSSQTHQSVFSLSVAGSAGMKHISTTPAQTGGKPSDTLVK